MVSVRTILACILCILLSGCRSAANVEISRLDPEALKSLSTAALCKPYAQGQNVSAERKRRGLSDCSAADQACVSAGYAAGSGGYARCRTSLLRGSGDCYFDGPTGGRLGAPVASKAVICSATP